MKPWHTRKNLQSRTSVGTWRSASLKLLPLKKSSDICHDMRKEDYEVGGGGGGGAESGGGGADPGGGAG
jgi:uncharacterized membrane protein YgcG